MANIEQNICDAIEVITNNIVSKAGFDKTIQATIITCVNEATGKYKIKYQDSTLYAYAGDSEKKYSKGNRVYVLVPGNDMTKDKTILGIVGQSEEYVATELGNVYTKVTQNLVLNPSNEYKIYSGTGYQEYSEQIYSLDGNPIVALDNKDNIAIQTKKCEYFWLGAKFRTNFNPPVLKGEYGIKVSFLCNNENEEGIYTDSITLDFQHGITGSYYNFINPEYRYFVFQKPSNFIQISSIEIFAKNFEAQLDDNIIDKDNVTESDYDIFISDLEIYGANSISKIVGSAGIGLVFPGGNSYKTGMTQLYVKANVYEKGKLMADNANEFYWFKKDLSVTSVTDPNYCDIGGLGWSCLNSKDSGGNWIPAVSSFYFVNVSKNFNILTSRENEFKVVSNREINDRNFVRYEEEFYLLNLTLDFDVILERTTNLNKPTLPRTTKDLSFQTKVINIVDGTDRPGIYKYYWSVSTNDRIWRIREEIQQQFNCIFVNNEIKNIDLSRLSKSDSSVDFSCTVKQIFNDEEIVLDTVTSSVVFAEASVELYSLILENGNLIFQYDEYGDAPTKNGTFIPKPVILKLQDNVAGEEVDLDSAIASGNLTIEWAMNGEPLSPTEEKQGTMISAILADGINNNYKQVNYTLLSPYNYNNIDSNQFEVKVVYNDKEFRQKTNFTFLTQGDAGTNGTSYSASIVPNVSSNTDIPKWVTFTTTRGGTEGEFNFGPDSDTKYKINSNGSYYYTGSLLEYEFPFKVQLNGGGELLVNDYKGNRDIHGNEISITWSMEVLKYDNTYWDKSNFSVADYNNQLVLKYNQTLYPPDSRIINDNINDNGDKEMVPANILKCAIKYIDTSKDKEYIIYATIPIVTIVNDNNVQYNLDIDQNFGYNEVVYNRDGCMPRYDNINKNFKINFISNYNTLVPSKCKWLIIGHAGIKAVGSNYQYIQVKNLKITEVFESNDNIIVEPIYKFNGSSATNAILFIYENSYVHIPIDMHLNRYGLAMLNEWDGTSIEINDNGGYILSPQVGAGSKDNENKFTGVLMGQAKEASQRGMHTGIFGFFKGEKTFGLHSDNGIAVFGKAGSSQIIIDPSSNSGCIYSSNFFTSEAIDQSTGMPKTSILNNLFTKPNGLVERRYDSQAIKYLGNPDDGYEHGMIIDFTSGHIYYGNDKFHLDNNGNLTSRGGHFSNDLETKETIYVDLAKSINPYPYFLWCVEQSNRNKINFAVSKDGEVIANLGKIGGFYIRDTFISSAEPITKAKDNGKSVISMSTIKFDRYNMQAVSAGNYYIPEGELLPDDDDILIDDSTMIDYKDISQLIKDPTFNTIHYSTGLTLSDLLFAIGDDFAITENGNIFARNIFAQGGLFTDIAVQELYVKNSMDIAKNLVVHNNAIISGTLQTGGNITSTDGGLSVKGNITTSNGDISGGTVVANNTLKTNYIATNSGNVITVNGEVHNSDDIFGGVLPWMTCGTAETPPTTLLDGHIYLVYEN